MNDFERALSDALKKASDDYRPSDQYAAKERFLHRLRRRQLFFATGGIALAGTAAVVAALLVFARDATPTQRAEPLPAAAALTEAPPDIAVGQRPSGVAYGDDSVWVANSGDGTVMVIDPVGREVVETFTVGGDPDDVAVGVGAAWVSDSGAGTITALPLPSHDVENHPVTIKVGEPGSVHMDVAPGADGLWIAKDDSLFRVDPMSFEHAAINSVEGPTDVAVGEGAVYVLGTEQIARVDPETLISSVIADISPSRNQDLAFRDGYLWIANGDAGEVTRLDPQTGEFSAPIYVGGNFSGIATEEDAIWVISGGASETGVLTRIDPRTLAVRGERAELTGRPYDITTGAGLVWIANHSAGTVSGLHPDALPGGPSQPIGEQEPVFVFGADGDIWAETFDGELIPVVATPDEERHPSLSPDGRYLAFERGPENRVEVRVVVRNLESGEERTIGDGSEGVSDTTFANWSPSFGPDGRLAVVRGRAGDVSILIVDVGSDALRELAEWPAIASYGAPNDADNVAWDLEGEYVYYNAGWEGFSLFQADASGDADPFELIPGNHRRFATYYAPSIRSELAVHVLRRCCQRFGDVPPTKETVELGVIHFTEGGPEYETVSELDPSRFPATSSGTWPSLDSAGNLTLEGTASERRWRHTVIRSWLFSWNRDIWLVDAAGRVVHVSDAITRDGRPFESIQGVEIAPEFDD